MRGWFALLALAGCPPSDEPDIPCGDTVALGTGTTSFEPLVDGGDLEFVRGNQGGFHLPLAARVCRVDDPGLVRVVATVEATGEVVSDILVDRAWLADGDCCAVLLDLIGYLSAPKGGDTGYGYYDPFDPDSIDGQVLRLALTVTDGAGETHVAEVRVTAHQP